MGLHSKPSHHLHLIHSYLLLDLLFFAVRCHFIFFVYLFVWLCPLFMFSGDRLQFLKPGKRIPFAAFCKSSNNSTQIVSAIEWKRQHILSTHFYLPKSDPEYTQFLMTKDESVECEVPGVPPTELPKCLQTVPLLARSCEEGNMLHISLSRPGSRRKHKSSGEQISTTQEPSPSHECLPVPFCVYHTPSAFSTSWFLHFNFILQGRGFTAIRFVTSLPWDSGQEQWCLLLFWYQQVLTCLLCAVKQSLQFSGTNPTRRQHT